MRSLMIVDDEKNIRYGLKTMVEREFPDQYEIRLAAQGQEALDSFREEPANIVITDIRMPVMDGIHLIEALAELEETTGVKPVVLILSGYDDFEYAKAAIRYQVKEYLLKPIRRDELFAALRKTEEALIRQAEVHNQVAASEVYLQQLQTHRLKELLELPQGMDMEAAANEIGFESFVKPFRVAVMKYKYEDGNSMNKDELKQLIDNMRASVEGRINACFLDSKGRVVLIGSPDGQFEKLARQFTEREMDGLFVGISREGFRIEDIRIGYIQALTALSYTFIHPNVKLMSHDDIQGELRTYPVPEESIRKLGNMLGTEREREIQALLLDIFHIGDMPHVAIDYLEFVSKRINEQVLDEVFRVYGESMVEVLKLYRKVGTMDNYRHFHTYFRNLEHLLLHVNEYVKGIRSAHSEHSEIKAAVSYMEENYHRPLNMAMVSNYVSLNYSYFSEAFKAHTGENFVVYLKKLRITKAKDLLQDCAMKLADIGKAVGFENTKQFSRVFKELEGISPHEYRIKVQTGAGLQQE
ncbi:response regulator [Paenibacillus sp. ISL-20]|uniref:response regulator n=1 Tax=Paenibacillus sp. ISL-20 TaxID=2819163 RepID=UPI001BE79548|nr:response regulator [Paenibacillus sp. ISL-20]MBT2765268.1 response regulator [Paenibacillus sp. ISL-20]